MQADPGAGGQVEGGPGIRPNHKGTLCPLLPQRRRRELLEQQACVLGLHRQLKAVEHMCSALQNNFREFCKDLPHQQRQVRALTDRYHTVGDQLDLR